MFNGEVLENGKAELSSEEWLDLIRTLHKCNVDELPKKGSSIFWQR